jgi:membrane peptidoglycan carboxypeptidase
VSLRNGKTIEGPDADCKRVISPEVSDAVTYMLQNVVRTGTGRAADIGRPQAGKTGTSQGFTAWFAGYTPQLAAAVGVLGPAGYNKPQYDLRNVSIGGRVFERVQGAQLPAPIWASAMKPALNGIPAGTFTAPEGRFFQGTKGPGVIERPTPREDRGDPDRSRRPDIN